MKSAGQRQSPAPRAAPGQGRRDGEFRDERDRRGERREGRQGRQAPGAGELVMVERRATHGGVQEVGVEFRARGERVCDQQCRPDGPFERRVGGPPRHSGQDGQADQRGEQPVIPEARRFEPGQQDGQAAQDGQVAAFGSQQRQAGAQGQQDVQRGEGRVAGVGADVAGHVKERGGRPGPREPGHAELSGRQDGRGGVGHGSPFRSRRRCRGRWGDAGTSSSAGILSDVRASTRLRASPRASSQSTLRRWA